MIDLYKTLISNQFEAAFCTLGACIDRCPDASWSAPVVKLKFCQVAFHTLFFADLYLGRDVLALREQEFHLEHATTFADYEELEDRAPQRVYERPFIKTYLLHCRDKASHVIAAETLESLQVTPGFAGRNVSRAELHVTNFRHIIHHAGQLTLRLRLDANIDIPWVTSGWREF